jgi:hypothetical protein
MKKSILFLASIALILLATSASYGQFHLWLGPNTGMNFNIHTGSDLPESGTGLGFVIGGEAKMMFTPMIGMISRIQFYDNRSGSYSTTRTVQAGDGNNVAITVDNSASIAYFMFEELFLLKLPKSNFFFVAGPAFGFSLEGTNEITEKITTPGYTFDGQNTTRKSKNSIKDMLARFELKFGAGYDFPITRELCVSPNVTFGFGLTNVVSDVSYKVLTFQLLGTVKWQLM